MSETFWRKELWHPVTVHFPIALLLVATLTQIIYFVVRGEAKRIAQTITFILLVAGTVGAWISLYTGDLADGIVARKICDPTLLKDHEIAAQATTYLFSTAAVLAILAVRFLNSNLKVIATVAVFILMFAGSFFLIRAGHLGARVVYEQGGGIHNHSVDCE